MSSASRITIGTIYGSSSGAFNLPDYRAQFMRGQNLGRKKSGDPDVTHRTGKPDAKDNVGTTQDAMVQLHQHYYKLATAATLSKGSAAAGPTVDPTEPTIGDPVRLARGSPCADIAVACFDELARDRLGPNATRSISTRS